MRRRLNFKFLAGLILAVILLGAGFYGLHAVQVKRSAGAFLRQAEQAESQGDREKALESLERYLLYRSNDLDAKVRYANLLAPGPETAKPGDLQPAIDIYKQVLVRRPDAADARRRCADLELKLYDYLKPLAASNPVRYDEVAQGALFGGLNNLLLLLAPPGAAALDDDSPEALKAQLEKAPADGHLKWQLGRCHEELKQHKLALIDYEAARRDDPALIDAYIREALILRTQPMQPDDLKLVAADAAPDPAVEPGEQAKQLADQIVDAMIANRPAGNGPENVEAHLARARYRLRFGLPGADQDVAQARLLDEEHQTPKPPEERKGDPDVVLMAAALAMEANPPDWAEARKLLEQGVKAHPQDVRMYQALALLEQRVNQPSQAEGWLRKGVDALPEDSPARLELQMQLVELLVLTGRSKPAEELLGQLRAKGAVSPYGLFLEASAQFNQGRWDQARELLEQFTADMGRRADQTAQVKDVLKRGFLMLGQCWERLAQAPEKDPQARQSGWKNAYSAYRSAAEIVVPNPQLDVKARFGVAAALLFQGLRNDAADEFIKLLKLPVTPPQVYQAVVQALAAHEFEKPADQRDWAGVDAVLNQIEPEVPDSANPARLRARGWVGLVKTLAASKQTAKAQEAVATARPRLEADHPLEMALCLELIGQAEEADAFYRKALAAQPDDRDVMITVAGRAIRGGRPDEAKDLLKRLIDQRTQAVGADAKEVVQYKQVLAALTAAGGNHQQVLEALSVLSPTDGAQAEGAAAAALARSQSRLLASRPSRTQRREAIRLLEGLAAQGDATADDRVILARLYEADGQWPKAHAVFQNDLLKNNDRNPALLAEYIGALLRNQGLAEARAHLARLEEVAPDQPRTLEMKARVLAADGQTAEAVKTLKTFAEGDRNRLAATAGLLEAIGAKEDAEAMYREVAAQFADKPGAVLPLAGFLGRQGRTAEAVALIDDRLWEQSAPLASNTCVSLIYGAAAPSQELFDQVVARIEQAIAKHPEQITLKFDLANVRGLQGRAQEAETIYRDVIAERPTLAAPLNNLAWLLALQGGPRLAEADQLIQKAISIDGETPRLLDTRAAVALKQGRTADAVRDLEDAIAVEPSGDKYFHLAQAYQAAGRAADAVESLKKAHELGLTAEGLDPLERPAYEQLKQELASQ